MRTRILYTDGKGSFVETEWNKIIPGNIVKVMSD